MRSSRSANRFLVVFFLSFLFPSTPLPAQRIPQRLDDSQTFALKGNTRPIVERGLLHDEGPVRASHKMPRMSLHFSMTPAQQADLAQLLIAQQDRRSPQYHQFLTPEQYAARFGPKPADLAPIVAWLEEKGFSDVRVARGGMWISFSGTAAHAESAFHVSMRNYSWHGETYFANSTDPQLPKGLAGIVQSVGGLNNFALKPQTKPVHPQFTSPSGGNYLAPDDWATIYDLQPLYGAGLDGSAVTIAVVGQSDVQLSDLRAFRTAAGLPAKDPTVVVPPGAVDPGFQNQQGDEGESDLDLEWAGGIARNANILFVTASATQGNGIFDSIAYVVDNNAAPIMTISYGGCEADQPAGFITSEEAIFQQASAQGITVLVSSGDAGATACDQDVMEVAATQGLAVSYPASSQYVTAVGGTTLESYYGNYFGPANNSFGGSALSYIPEQVWNDGFQSAGGGGASSVLPKPSWQAGAGVPADNARDVPDLAFAASPNHNGYLICSLGWCTNGFFNANNYLQITGGTSASAPSFAGLLALVVQKNGNNRLGNINTNLYSLAQISPNAFHDITQGNNRQSCQSGTPNCTGNTYIGYDAGPGYDQATGLGSVDAYNFAQQWFGDFSLSPSTKSLTIQPGTSASATVSVVPQNNFQGQVTVSCSVAGSLIDVTCSVPSGAVSAGGSTIVTITAAASAKTPWWMRRPSLPPINRNWMLMALAILVLSAALYTTRHRSLYQSSLYAFACASLLVIGVGSLSCGGTGSTSSISGPTVPALSLTCNLPNAIYGSAYSGSCTASGGTAPYTYSGGVPAGFVLNPSSGAITGTPASFGSFQLALNVSDSETPQHSATTTAALTVVAPSLSISCQLPPASVGNAYTGSCMGIGGIAPLSYRLTSGALPPGLSLNSGTGVISGTPMFASTLSFAVSVIDSVDQSVAFSVNNFVVTATPLTMSCSLPSGATGSYYTGACSTTGGSPPASFSISAGDLPLGLSISGNGLINGSPATPGTSSFTVRAADRGSPPQVAQLNQSITIVAGQLTLNCYLGLASVNKPYASSRCTASQGNPPYTYSIASGALPAGLTLNSSTGVVSGTPTVAGASSFVFQVTDSSSPAETATVTESAFVVQAIQPFTLTCPALTGSLAFQFSGGCVSSGGNSPVTASVIAGTLPPGLFLIVYPQSSTSGNATVNFVGSPTAMGTSTATLQVTDGSVPALTATAQATITIGPRAPETGLVTITAVSGGITNTTTISVSVP